MATTSKQKDKDGESHHRNMNESRHTVIPVKESHGFVELAFATKPSTSKKTAVSRDVAPKNMAGKFLDEPNGTHIFWHR